MGAVNFNGLACQSINVATSGIIATTPPTCANPSFVIAIPKCTTASQDLFSMSIKGNQVGQAYLYFTGLKAVGVSGNTASNVASVWEGGSYNILATTAQPTQQPQHK